MTDISTPTTHPLAHLTAGDAALVALGYGALCLHSDDPKILARTVPRVAGFITLTRARLKRDMTVSGRPLPGPDPDFQFTSAPRIPGATLARQCARASALLDGEMHPETFWVRCQMLYMIDAEISRRCLHAITVGRERMHLFQSGAANVGEPAASRVSVLNAGEAATGSADAEPPQWWDRFTTDELLSLSLGYLACAEKSTDATLAASVLRQLDPPMLVLQRRLDDMDFHFQLGSTIQPEPFVLEDDGENALLAGSIQRAITALERPLRIEEEVGRIRHILTERQRISVKVECARAFNEPAATESRTGIRRKPRSRAIN